MGLGLKRICQQCSSKFYDLEKDPILCPKCGSVFDPEAINKPKRGRRKASAAVEIEDTVEDIEIDLDDAVIDDLDDDSAIEELDDEIREEMEIDDEDDDSHIKDENAVLTDLEDDTDDIIDDAPDKD